MNNDKNKTYAQEKLRFSTIKRRKKSSRECYNENSMVCLVRFFPLNSSFFWILQAGNVAVDKQKIK